MIMEHPENNAEYKGLVVNAGIEQPASVNPYLKNRPRRKRHELSVADYVDGIVKGNTTVLGQAVTLVESLKPEHQLVAQEVIEKCLPYAGSSIRIGISGVPGAGKSTSIDAFGLHVLEKHVLMLIVVHVYEIDYYDSAHVPEPELPCYLVRRVGVHVECVLLLLFVFGACPAVYINYVHGLCVFYHEVGPLPYRNDFSERTFNLAGDVEVVEYRLSPFV